MVKIEVEIPDKLAVKFPEAVTAYNDKHSTPEVPLNLTNKQMLLKLLRDFTKDTLHATRIKAADDAAKEELKDL